MTFMLNILENSHVLDLIYNTTIPTLNDSSYHRYRIHHVSARSVILNLSNYDYEELIESDSSSHYEMLLNECFENIVEFCNIFDIFINRQHLDIRYSKYSKKRRITFHRFKGFEHYFKKIFGYSLILQDNGIPAEHQKIRNNCDFETMIYGHPMASHGLCYESMNAIEGLYE